MATGLPANADTTPGKIPVNLKAVKKSAP